MSLLCEFVKKKTHIKTISWVHRTSIGERIELLEIKLKSSFNNTLFIQFLHISIIKEKLVKLFMNLNITQLIYIATSN